MPNVHRTLTPLVREHEATFARPSQHTALHQDIGDTPPCDGVASPQPLRLVDGERKSKHLPVFAQDALDQGGVARIVSRHHDAPHAKAPTTSRPCQRRTSLATSITDTGAMATIGIAMGRTGTEVM